MFAGIALSAGAKPGIKSIVVFGDSLSDAGNIPLWADNLPNIPDLGLPYPDAYYMGRGSNGPVWIEVVAAAYGYDVSPSLAGGTNFAFAGAESGPGLSDQGTPNFHTQIGMWKQAVMDEVIAPPMPWQLFVVWFGPNDMLRYIVETLGTGGEFNEEGITMAIQTAVTNLVGGIVAIHEAHGRMFLVPNLPSLDKTPWGMNQPAEFNALLAQLTGGFNAALDAALDMLEENYDKMTILRLDVNYLMNDIFENPSNYGNLEVNLPAYLVDPGILLGDPDYFLSWDGFHPTAFTHSLLAQKAMDIIPIGSWWGHAKARGPDGNALLEMGWINDSHWPWVYVYGMDGGQWMWIIEESGSPDGYVALIPNGYKWIFLNYRTGEYYDYTTGKWSLEP